MMNTNIIFNTLIKQVFLVLQNKKKFFFYCYVYTRHKHDWHVIKSEMCISKKLYWFKAYFSQFSQAEIGNETAFNCRHYCLFRFALEKNKKKTTRNYEECNLILSLIKIVKHCWLKRNSIDKVLLGYESITFYYQLTLNFR